MMQDRMLLNLQARPRSLIWCLMFWRSDGAVDWEGAFDTAVVPFVIGGEQIPINQSLDQDLGADEHGETHLLKQWLVDGAMSGQLLFTGRPSSDPLTRQDIPKDFFKGNRWLWFQGAIMTSYGDFIWGSVEISAAGELSKRQIGVLRVEDMRHWVDRHPGWFERTADGKFKRIAGPAQIARALRQIGSPVWADVSDGVVKQLILGIGSYARHGGLSGMDSRVL
jgi:hypothetical protein